MTISRNLSLFIAIIFILFSCSKERVEPGHDQPAAFEAGTGVPCGDVTTVDFLAGQYDLAGSVEVYNDDINLFVVFSTINGWEMAQTHLYAGACADIPTNNGGNPIIGQFPFATNHNPRVTSYVYTISLGDLDSCMCIAAHAEVAKVDSNGNVIQSETAWGNGNGFPGNSWAMFFEFCEQPCDDDGGGDDCDGRTQTQGGWGTNPNGNNPGVYNHANFASAFPNGLTVGCTYTITLSSAQAVTDLLPEGGPAAALTQSYVDPTNLGNVFVGQVVALSLSVGYDSYDPDFGAAATELGDMIIAVGQFAGLTVSDLLAEANKALGGCPSQYDIRDLNVAISKINENFVDGTMNGGFLNCPPEGGGVVAPANPGMN